MATFDPSECYELSDFGFGPFPVEGGTPVCPPHPEGAGYGGSGYGFFPYGDRAQFLELAGIDGGYGGDPYGTGPFGSHPGFPAPPYPVDGGYGGDPYGYGPYGSKELSNPSITGAISLDGFRIEIFFDEEMDINAALLDPSSYTINVLSGGAPASVLSVEVGVMGAVGANSVIITHTGTTLGGVYEITIIGPTDLSANPIEGSGNVVSLLTKGDPPTFTITPLSGTQLLVQFSEDMLDEATFPGIEDVNSYQFTSTPDYPVTLEVTSVTHPNAGDYSQVLLDVQGMTSLTYELLIEPATAILYDGSVLPDADPSFLGTEVGTGTSSIAGGDLLLNKASGVTYGWNFEDTSGRLLPGSSFRVDLDFDASVATYLPALFDAVLGALHVNDGAIQASIILERIAGVDTLTVSSGAYLMSVAADWSTAGASVSLVRNQQADTYTLLFNGYPLLSTATANFTGAPSIPVGAQFLLGTTYQVTNFKIANLLFTSTQTIFSVSWNFLHNQAASFVGNSATTNNQIYTQCGPLVKGWGDGTPATEQDVAVYVNGVSVEIAEVNPYIGLITLTVPVPLMPAGTITVEVDYKWFPLPIMEMVGLNIPGLVLNKWSEPQNRVYPTIPGTPPEQGIPDWYLDRFQMRVVLGPIERIAPKLIGHRYIGFEKDYSALLNSPTTLLLNQDPHSIAVEDFQETPIGISIGYDGTIEPPLADPPWTLQGVDSGFSSDVTGVHTLSDASAGSFEVGTEAFYYQDVDLSFDSSVVLAARFLVTDFIADGVFSGIGFGTHNNRRLYLVGCLEINGVQHVGLLRNIALPHLAESWILGPTREVEVLDAGTFRIPTALFPTSIEQGDRFQILAGPQSGIYIIDNYINQTDGTTTVILDSTTQFPGDPKWWGNDKADAVFEVVWSDVPSTYRLVVNTQTGAAQLFVSGEISSLAVDLQTMPEVALAAQTPFLFNTDGEGQVFWGSLGRIPTNESVWSFFRYGITPLQTTFHSRGIIVSTDLSQYLAEDDPNTEWFRTQDFGFAEVDTISSRGLIKALSSDESLNLTFGYGRVEPLFHPDHNLDFDGKFRVDTESRGFGDAEVIIRDTFREIRLGTVLYREDILLSPYRQLINLPTVSLSGLQIPADVGWTPSTGLDITAFARGQRMTTTQEVGQGGTWYSDLDLSGLNFTDEGGRVIEARFGVLSYTSNVSGDTGIIFGGEAGTAGASYLVALTLLDAVSPDPARVALTSDGTPLQTYDFDWTDGAQHIYRILIDGVAGTVTLVIDDVVQVPTLNLATFNLSSQNTMLFLGAFGTDTAHVVEWDAVSMVVRAPSDAKRTLGIWVGGDRNDIDNLALPRTDGTSAENSTILAVIEEMDWRSDVEFRLHRDAEWGVLLQRPDLPLPPFFTGQFATSITEPSAGWISVEYPRIPLLGGVFSSILWGSLETTSITQQRWEYVRYRIYNHFNDEFRSPEHMVLNYFNVITSGEPTQDKTPEIVSVTSLTSTIISLRPANIYASLIYKVVEGQTIIPFEEWTFDEESQTIFLHSSLSGENVAVTVVFRPGKPITTTYLEAQPLLDSITLLNEGTPPIPKQQTEGFTAQVTFGSQLNDPNDVLNTDPDFILNDPYRYLQDVDDPEALYECMQFIEIYDDGETRLISSMCDTSFCGNGLVEFAFSGGSMFSEIFKTPIGDYNGILGAGPGNTGPGSIQSPLYPNQYPVSGAFPILHASGGNFVDGKIGSSIIYPNYPSVGKPGEGLGGIGLGVSITLTLSAVPDGLGGEIPLEDTFLLSPTADNTPPSFSNDPNLVPNGTPGVNLHGAVLLVFQNPAEYSRVGPWGGLASLEPSSLVAGVNPSQPTGIPVSGTAFTIAGGVPLPGSATVVVNVEAAN